MSYPRRRWVPRTHSRYAQQDPRPLMTHSPMPMGPYVGKHMHQVPSDWLLWVDAQVWAERWPAWKPIRDYIARHPAVVTGEVTREPLIFVERHRIYPNCWGHFKDGSGHLHTLPGHEDKLHAFAVGALNLNPDWYQPGTPPHYDVTVNKHGQALRAGALLIEDRQLIEHRRVWERFFSTKPQMDPDGDPIAYQSQHARQREIRDRINPSPRQPNPPQR